MTIKSNKSNHVYLIAGIESLLAMLHILPVEVAINRLYVAEHNDVVLFNFTYKKVKYLLTRNATNPDAYEYSISSKNKNKHIITMNDDFKDQIMDYIK